MKGAIIIFFQAILPVLANFLLFLIYKLSFVCNLYTKSNYHISRCDSAFASSFSFIQISHMLMVSISQF